jgi:hypothetical protein
MATFRQATIAGEQMENPVFTGPFDIYSVYCIFNCIFSPSISSGASSHCWQCGQLNLKSLIFSLLSNGSAQRFFAVAVCSVFRRSDSQTFTMD